MNNLLLFWSWRPRVLLIMACKMQIQNNILEYKRMFCLSISNFERLQSHFSHHSLTIQSTEFNGRYISVAVQSIYVSKIIAARTCDIRIKGKYASHSATGIFISVDEYLIYVGSLFSSVWGGGGVMEFESVNYYFLIAISPLNN